MLYVYISGNIMIVKCNTLLVGSMTWPLLLKCCTKKIQDKALPFAQQLLTLFLFIRTFRSACRFEWLLSLEKSLEQV